MSSRSSQALTTEHHAAVPWWRDIRVLRWLFQFGILAIVIALVLIVRRNLVTNLEDLGLNLSFEFLSRPAGFAISEGPEFDIRQTMGRAYVVSVVNTLRVAGVGIVLATILGTLVGVLRLSRNWLISRIMLVYIEIIQNTPLLIQLFFWFTLILALPRQRQDEILRIPSQMISIGPLQIPSLAFFSQRAAALPGIQTLDAFRSWWPFLIVGIVVAAIAWRVRVYLNEQAGRPPSGQFQWAVLAFIAVAAIGWVIVPGAPLRVVFPQLIGEPIANYEGGWILTNNFQAILLGLVLYTAAFIAEAVRAGIQAVSAGQVEAARSIGLKGGQRLRLVILPQALRVTIPPLVNQYLSLVKNSSLAIAVGYPDLFNTSQTVGNQTGQNIQIIAIVMTTYLSISLTISLIMSFVNERMQIVER
jgi:general L-amino acid transport system permease protein